MQQARGQVSEVAGNRNRVRGGETEIVRGEEERVQAGIAVGGNAAGQREGTVRGKCKNSGVEEGKLHDGGECVPNEEPYHGTETGERV